MDYIIACFSGITSFGYICHLGKKFVDYKKFVTNGYIDDYHLISGKLTSHNSMNSIIEEFKGHKNENIIVKNLCVEVGKKKIGTNYIPMKVGNTTIMIPQQYEYTDWKTVHSKTYHFNDFTLECNHKVKLLTNNFTAFFTHNHLIQENNFSRQLELYKIFDKHLIDYKNGDKVKVNEQFICNNEEVSVFGKYISNKEMDVKYLGNKHKLIDAVRQNVCKLSGGKVFLAGCVLVGSICYMIAEYENAKESHYRNKNYRDINRNKY
jgi:hypothetical protein